MLGKWSFTLVVSALLAGTAAGAQTKLVLLGTGNPRPTPERSGPASAVVYNHVAYIFDAGPGIVRRASAAAERDNIPALTPRRLSVVFLTHLHSDHTLGLPDLIFSPWVMGRKEPLEVYGPKGTRKMVDHLEAAWRQDIDIRIQGLEHANDTGYRAIVHEIEPGVVYREGQVEVTAVPVHHGSWPQAYGYRVRTPDRVIVISGDCAPGPALVEACQGCDILLHEVYSEAGIQKEGEEWVKYMHQFHTSAAELADIAAKAHPKLLVLYHFTFSPDARTADAVLRELKQHYHGLVVAGNDLDVY